MQEFLDSPLGASVLNALSALAILIVGYIVARLVASIVRRLLKRTNVDNRLSTALKDDTGSPAINIEQLVPQVVFWIVILFVLVAVLQKLNLPAVATPINALLEQITTVYLPRFGGAMLLFAIAWLIARTLKFLVLRAGAILKVDERLTRYAALSEGERVSVTQSLATAVFWFIFLLFLPSVLTKLGINEIADPVEQMFGQVFAYIPNVFGALILFAVGWLIARIIRQIINNLLASLGVDNFGLRLGLSGERSLSRLAGTTIYTFIMLFTIVAALDKLAIEAISGPATLMLTTILNAVPDLVGAVLVLTVSYFVGRMVASLITDMLTTLGVNGVPEKLGFKLGGGRTLSQWIGYLLLVGVMLFAAVSAAEILGFTFLADILTTFTGFLGQVVLAAITFSIGLYLANMAYQVILSTGGATFTASIARLAILVLAGAMGLRQLGIADDIVNMAFGILLGALGIAAALAFGLGSREIAGREVERFLHTIRDRENNK